MGSRINYHLYTDGSAFQDTNKYGIGWVRTNHKDRNPSLSSKRLKLERATSLIAELYAASRALDHVPRRSKIVLHTDCRDLCAAIALNEIPERINRARKTPALKEAWEAVQKAVSSHIEVSVHFTTTTKEHPHLYMDIAHRLAQEGAFKAFNKAAEKADKGATHTRRRHKKALKNHSVGDLSALDRS